MSSPYWLPPLNCHDNYRTYISVMQKREATNDKSHSEMIFSIKLGVEVSFSAPSLSRIIDGLQISEKFSIPCRLLTCSSQEYVKNLVSQMLNHMNIPFQLDKILFIQRHKKDSWSKLSQEDPNSWIDKLQNFLYDMAWANYNKNCNVFPLKISIKKSILVPHHEFEAWVSWFDEKRMTDPDFLKDYNAAISRRRTNQELLDADMTFKEADKSSIDALEEAMEVDDDSELPIQCLVCLEEFSNGSKACRLTCSHAFHKECITKWLQKSNMCPLCRASFCPSVSADQTLPRPLSQG